MTFWEFAAAVAGWTRAQGGGHAHVGDPLTDEEYDALCDLAEMWNGRS